VLREAGRIGDRSVGDGKRALFDLLNRRRIVRELARRDRIDTAGVGIGRGMAAAAAGAPSMLSMPRV
jgi:hypothetical protein